ncbi:hypothetical protein JCM5353_002650 [Sporobolomyces roseus]
MPTADQPDILVATMPDVRPLASLLKSLSFKSRATLKIDSIGLRMIVEEGRSIQAHAFISSSCFSTYSFSLDPQDPSAFYDETPHSQSHDVDESSPSQEESSPAPEPRGGGPPHCEMTVSLSTMLECLNIFGNAGVGSSNPFKRDYDGDSEKRIRGRGGDEEEENEGRGGGGGGGGGRRWGRDKEKGAGGGEEKQTSLKLSYKGLGEPVVLLLEEGGIVTRCELTTYEPEGLLDLTFIDQERVQRLIMKSEWLRDALLELPPSSEKLSISFSPIKDQVDEDEQGVDEEDVIPLFRLEATGAAGSTEMDYSDNKDILEVFECENPIRNSYKFSHIQLTKHALNNSIKTSIRTDDYGLVSFQFMIPLSSNPAKLGLGKKKGGGIGGAGAAAAEEGRVAYVEFLCVALDE